MENNAINVNLNVELKANAELMEQLVTAQKSVIDFEMQKMTEMMDAFMTKWTTELPKMMETM